MSFKDQLQECAQSVDNALKNLILSHPSPSEHLQEALLYSSIGSGKKMRPWLVIESARILNANLDNALQCALAVECVHTYSLIHDDLPAMDDDDMRRGKPTTHIAYDEATAILTGDSLLTLAFEILASEKTHQDPNVRIKLITALSQASGSAGMVAGQMLDLSAARDTFTMQQTNEMQALKTGKLIEFSCMAGGILAQSNKETLNQFRTYGQMIGLAFQITDDLLDAEGSEEKTGKRAGKDKEKGKSTYIDFLGLEGARNQARELVDKAKYSISDYGEKADNLKQIADYILTREN